MKLIVAIIVWTLGGLVTSLVEVFAFKQLWSWFLAAQYGHGPSSASWFGLAVIVGAVLALSKGLGKSDDDDSLIGKVIVSQVGTCLRIGLILFYAWAVGSMAGWAS